MRLLLPILFCIIALAGARVTFPYSEVIQATDLVNGVAPFDCSDGCKVHVDQQTDDLQIAQNGRFIASFSQIADVYASNGLVLKAGNNYVVQSIGNYTDFVLYAVSAKSLLINDVPVYLPKGKGILTNGFYRYSTFLSSSNAIKFSDFYGTFPEGYPRIYSTGFDGVEDSTCTPVYQARSQSNAELSQPIIFSPIITVDFGYEDHGHENLHSVKAHQNDGTDLYYTDGNAGSVSYMSPGFVGCASVGSQMYYSSVDIIEAKVRQDVSSLIIEASCSDVPSSDSVYLYANYDQFSLVGTTNFSKSYGTRDNEIELYWNRQTYPYAGSWLIQLEFNVIPSTTPTMKTSWATTTRPVATTPSRTSSATTTRPAVTTPPSPSPDSYCKCDVKWGLPVGWNYNDIWVDIVVILDTSEAMGKSNLEDAGELIESFISDGINDFLVTDTNSKFYSRVGVISMAETATTLFNLNMTKYDTMRGKASVKAGLFEIDVVAAFEAALKMFSDGLNINPGRSNARQVIYYMTDSNPKKSLDYLNEFKSQGVIIVNNFLKDGEQEVQSLKNLASDGYYFANGDYVTAGLQSFCKANCFCPSDKFAYGGSDPAISAAGGCYHATPTGVPFNKAKTTCASGGGILTTIHDEQKGHFLQQLMTSAKSDYFWMGYEKSENGAWQWEDGSTDPFTNWDFDEPSSASVAKCAYADASRSNVPWGAGNCQLGLPHVCQYPPCSVGKKDC